MGGWSPAAQPAPADWFRIGGAQPRLQHLEEELGPVAAATQLKTFPGRWGQAFQEIVPLAMHNPSIALQWDQER